MTKPAFNINDQDTLPVITLPELRAILKLSKPGLMRILHDPIDPLPSFRIGRRRRVRRCDLDEWLATRQIDTAKVDKIVEDVAATLSNGPTRRRGRPKKVQS